MVRDFISDEACFDRIEEMIKDEEDPLFTFCVTMQNHSPYTKEYENSIELLEYTDSQVEQYMSLIHESDRALQKLIEDLEKSDEPTVVVFLEIIFRHCPKIFTSMYLERQMRK